MDEQGNAQGEKFTGENFTAAEWTDRNQELQNAITESGQTLGVTSQTQLGSAMANYSGQADFYDVSGSDSALVLNAVGGSSMKLPTILRDGMKVRFKWPFATQNAASLTLLVSAIGLPLPVVLRGNYPTESFIPVPLGYMDNRQIIELTFRNVGGGAWIFDHHEKHADQVVGSANLAATQAETDINPNSLAQAVANYAMEGDVYLAIGSANNIVLFPIAHTLTPTRQLPTFYAEGMKVRFIVAFSKVLGNTTLAIGTLGAQSFNNPDGSEINTAGDLTVGQLVEAIYQNGKFIFSNKPSASTAEKSGLDHRSLDGLTLNIFEGSVTSVSGGQIIISDGINKTFPTTWTEGDSGGLVPTGVTLAADTWYAFFIVGNASTGQSDFGIDDTIVNEIPTNLMAVAGTAFGANISKQIGWIKTRVADANTMRTFDNRDGWYMKLEEIGPTADTGAVALQTQAGIVADVPDGNLMAKITVASGGNNIGTILHAQFPAGVVLGLGQPSNWGDNSTQNVATEVEVKIGQSGQPGRFIWNASSINDSVTFHVPSFKTLDL